MNTAKITHKLNVCRPHSNRLIPPRTQNSAMGTRQNLDVANKKQGVSQHTQQQADTDRTAHGGSSFWLVQSAVMLGKRHCRPV